LNYSPLGGAPVRQRSHLGAGIPLQIWAGAVRSAAVRRPIILLCAALSLVFATAAPHLGALSVDAPAAASPAAVAAAAPNLALASVKLVPFAAGLDSPVAMAWRNGDNRPYVAQQTGKVVIVTAGHIVATALDITSQISHGNEQGLLGLTFTRDGRKMYIFYTDVNGTARIVEYKMNGALPNLGTRRVVLSQPHPTYSNHNGGELMIGRDNLLYASFGDGGGGGDPFNNAQNLTTLAGKIIRIDPRPTATAPYRISPYNPFYFRPGARKEILMYGLRNPWRYSLDRVTGDMWIGDVGQDLYEEIDFAAATHRGFNYGWNKREGFHPYNGGARPPGSHDPLLERPHTAGDCAIVGGYVYRGALIPNLPGGYLYGDFCTGEIRAVVQVNGAVTQSRDLGLNVSQLTSFGEGPYGGIYAISRAGTIAYFTKN